MRLVKSSNERSRRFPKNQESEGGNLYARTWELLLKRKYSKAEQELEEHLLRDPFSGEAILSWTELKLYQGDMRAVMERVSPLTDASPKNPYYLLATTLLVAQGSDSRALDFPSDFAGYLEEVANCSGGCSDVFAKMGLASIMRRRMWTSGMYYFLEAIKAKERNSVGPADLILLEEKNERGLESYLNWLRALEDDPVNEVSLELIVRTICILLIAYEDLGIAEAWAVAVKLANSRREIAGAWNDLNSLFSRFCPDWIQVKRMDGREPLVRARRGGLVASPVKIAWFGQLRSTYFQTTVFRSGRSWRS